MQYTRIRITLAREGCHELPASGSSANAASRKSFRFLANSCARSSLIRCFWSEGCDAESSSGLVPSEGGDGGESGGGGGGGEVGTGGTVVNSVSSSSSESLPYMTSPFFSSTSLPFPFRIPCQNSLNLPPFLKKENLRSFPKFVVTRISNNCGSGLSNKL